MLALWGWAHDRDCVAVRDSLGTREGIRGLLRSGGGLDRRQPPEPVLSRQLVPARPEPRVTLPRDRVLERDARRRATQAVPAGSDPAARGPARRAGDVDRTDGDLHGARRPRSGWTYVVTSVMLDMADG